MDAFRLLLVLVVVSTSECSVKEKCKNDDLESYLVLEGEAFYFVPYIFDYIERPPHEEVTWYKNTSKVENVSADDSDRIHYHGAELFLLDLVPEDSGLYTARYAGPSGGCRNARLNLTVVKTSFKNNSRIFYGAMKTTNTNPRVQCQNVIEKICKKFKGNFTWYKNFTLIPGENKKELRVMNATENDNGVYTCVCSWTRNHKLHNSSGSRLLTVRAPIQRIDGITITSPTTPEPFAEEGSEIKLNCSVSCEAGETLCHAFWESNGKAVSQLDRYNQTTEIIPGGPLRKTISNAILTITKVSAKDFETDFKCNGQSSATMKSITVTLKRKSNESVVPMIVRGLCVLFICVGVAVLVRCFAVDLALFFRPCFPRSSHNKDLRAYDAYVVYQTHNLDKATEDTLCRFVMDALPSVLEEKCGYRLFIHGRDDKPGEDSVELAEDRMKQSRRLIVILTLGSETQSEITGKTPAVPLNSEIQGFDWQVGLQHTLVQRDRNVIVIQLGDLGPKGYTCLCPNMQQLLHHNAPIRWEEGSLHAAAWNSRFWKRVRYLMPAVPVRRLPPSAVV